MIVTEILINNLPAPLRFTTEYAYVEEGCLWLYNNAEDVMAYPLGSVASFKFTTLVPKEKDNGSTKDSE